MDNIPNSERGNVLSLVINDKRHNWHSQYISGAEIRNLGNIPKDEDIFLQIKEPWTDELVLDDTSVNLARPSIEHFFSKEKPVHYKIIVNGILKVWHDRKITFIEVVGLAFDNLNATNTYTVVYDKGPHENKEGSMVDGDCVFVKDKMIFNVTETHNS